MSDHPRLLQTVLDATEVRRLAEFYRELLGLSYRPGDEVPTDGEDRPDWLTLVDDQGRPQLAIQEADALPRSTWPSHDVPQQLHLDLTVDDLASLARHHERVLALGATLLMDRTDNPDERLYVYADPEGHPFCIFVG